MTNSKRGKVWLAVSGLVIDEKGRWLVVKKRYGGLKGKWSLPAGFVDENETADEAVLREVFEETGVRARVKGLIGLRTGVINHEISDNMLLFSLAPSEGSDEVSVQEKELFEVRWMQPQELLANPDASVIIHKLIQDDRGSSIEMIEGINPGNQFGYTAYKLFL
ncbi:NUDIX domain-containing protein [Falsibacillus albus]|uniref:NUDIX domain-containing protein n=1 Tax=Falsibacillus albus TaxID=2478915 RepID=UPI001F227A9D|nr:NUDIX hydrolase [Falsibacillus albus]